jgi:CubicO group peptidase (beta-lactamase class C family)
MKHLTQVLVAVILLSGCQLNNGMHSSQEVIELYANENLLNGTIIVGNRDSILYQGNYGFANKETQTPITADTQFPIHFVSQQFIATAILMLQEEGALNIEEPIDKYMEVPATLRSIPIKYFMTNTSGIANYAAHGIPAILDSIIAFHRSNKKPQFAPNEQFQYNNSNFVFLALLIEAVSNQSYTDFMQTRIFDAAGLHNTYIFHGNKSNYAMGYGANGKKSRAIPAAAEGNIISTRNDLQKWDSALFEGNLLSKASKEEMFAFRYLNDGSLIDYGLGWNINNTPKGNSLFEHLTNKKDKKKVKVVSHTGKINYYAAYYQHNLATDEYVIFLTNQVRPEHVDLIANINKALKN